MLFRWFVGLNMDDPVWHPTTFTKNRDRLLAGDVAAAFFDAVRAQVLTAGLLSDEHFTVDGTQLEAWASLKSFRPRAATLGEPPSLRTGWDATEKGVGYGDAGCGRGNQTGVSTSTAAKSAAAT